MPLIFPREAAGAPPPVLTACRMRPDPACGSAAGRGRRGRRTGGAAADVRRTERAEAGKNAGGRPPATENEEGAKEENIACRQSEPAGGRPSGMAVGGRQDGPSVPRAVAAAISPAGLTEDSGM